ncbi:uncharacterized protein PG998_011341 [Apiospora kogelbergensis]|uniref:Zn(2)-C6 fungal-type domain-containing protein n=1 Tax=Apiospora kogelbergensis TaxID=1337665 RepID=A0AAW0RC74_9PEZI
MTTSKQDIKQLRRACDRCYELKARCQPVASATKRCSRCERLGLDCATVRPVRPAGRKLQRRKLAIPVRVPEDREPDDVVVWLSSVVCLRPEERELLVFLLGRPGSLDCYVVCPSFQVAAQQALVAQLSAAAFPTVKDAYLAFASALKQLDPALATGTNDIVRHASAAMETLRSLPIANQQDAATCLTLGASLALSMHSTIGMGAADICRYCITATMPYVENMVASDGHSRSWHGFMVLLETMDCLVHRQKPSLRIHTSTVEDGVDRHLGLCSPLLPYYYDLCAISHSLASKPDTSVLALLHKQLGGIQTSVEAWRPSHTAHLAGQFTSAETIHLLAQAKVYRLGVLLVSHRLRHAFGERDDPADIWSKEIMMELELAQQVTTRPIRCVTLPFMIAAVEVRDPRARGKTLECIDHYVNDCSPIVRDAARDFLRRLWRDRDLQVTSCWLDSVHKPCPVIQSIEMECSA